MMRRQQKQRGIPEKESPGIFTPKYDPRWRQKEINSEVPAGQFLRGVQFLHRSELARKVNNSEDPAGDFAPAGQSLRSVQFLRRSEFHASRTIST